MRECRDYVRILVAVPTCWVIVFFVARKIAGMGSFEDATLKKNSLPVRRFFGLIDGERRG